ncbi:MAG: glycosyltransferase involved in cell wall biosynthesis [Colwellia sp.]|jgi:glycosyltransferase involved in cell wall biosynthesis
MSNLNFTVVIPLFNKAEHILRTLKSVTWQKYPAAEIIVIDDGSTDEGPAIVKSAKMKNLTLVHQKNQGVSAARNNGVALASHKYIAFLDADDQWLPLFLDEVARLIVKFPQAKFFGTRYQIVESENNYCDAKIKLGNINPEGVILENYFNIASQGNLPFTMSSMVIQRSLFEEIGGFPLDEPIGEDQDLFCRVALNADIAYSPNIHSFYHKDAQNQASKNNIPSTECGFSIRITKEARKDSKKHNTVHMLKYSAAHLCHLAKLNIGDGHFAQARTLLSDPRCKLKPKHLIGLYGLSWIKQTSQWLTNFTYYKQL